MSNIRNINGITTRYIYLSGSKQSLYFDMNLKTKDKGKFMKYVYSNTSVVSIGGGFFELSRTGRKSNLVGFDYNL